MSDFTQWMQARIGKFTASEVHKLLKGGTRSMTKAELEGREKGDRRTTVDVMFGEGAMTYIESVVAEIMTQQPITEFNSQATDWGNANEPYAAEEYAKRTGHQVEYYGGHNPEFSSTGTWPVDHLTQKVNEDGIAEIKCPFNSTKHIQNLRIKTVERFKKDRPEYYWQAQMNMLCTRTNWCDFVSYDERVLTPALRMSILRIERNEDDVNQLRTAIAEAEKLVAEMLKEISQ